MARRSTVERAPTEPQPGARRRPRTPATKKPAREIAPTQPAVDASAKPLREIAESIAGLREDVRALREGAGRPPVVGDLAATTRALQELVERLTRTGDALAGSLQETPKAADFEPLAEHLYEFARNAPRLLEALQEIPRAAAPIEASVRALHEISETLQFTRESFGESLLRLPRAEDYEPLATPLREFAKVSPALAESLSAVLRIAAPLGESVRGLQEVAESLRQSHATVAELLRSRPAVAPLASGTSSEERGGAGSHASERAPRLRRMESGAASLEDQTLHTLRAVDASLERAGQSIEEALATLPTDPDYASVAARLRELATVSPSLMEWLEEVPRLTMPLAESVDGLKEAAASLKVARDRLSTLIR